MNRIRGRGSRLPDVPANMTEVLINEEYGYRYWRFLFNGNREELIIWWKNLASVNPFFFNPGTAVVQRGLGQIEKVDQDRRVQMNAILGRCCLLLELHEDDDSCLLVLGNSNPGNYLIPSSVVERIYHAGFKQFDD
jgi:hypothetical protein